MSAHDYITAYAAMMNNFKLKMDQMDARIVSLEQKVKAIRGELVAMEGDGK